MQLIRRLVRDRRGATTVEFAITILPFALLIFAILQVVFMLFIDSALDMALQKTAREVRTGTASKSQWNLATFKTELCANMSGAFNCKNNLRVMTTVMADFSGVNYVSPVKNGKLSVAESFSTGAQGDYILIQAFLTFSSLLSYSGASGIILDDGTYALSAAALFKIEPFE